MHRHEIAVLNALRKSKKLDLKGLLAETKLGRDEAMWAVLNLEAEGLVEARKEAKEEATLTEEGRKYAKEGLPEHALIGRLGPGGVEIRKLSGKEDQIGFMWAKKKGLVTIDKGMVKLTEKGKEKADKGMEEERMLRDIGADNDAYEKYKKTEAVSEFKARGIMEMRSREEVSGISITQKGMKVPVGEAEQSEGMEGVDRNMIRNRLWVGKKFKEYNIDAPVERREVAMRHPLRRIMDDFREAYLGLGFNEISGPIIEPSFWVFDHLFMPQDHPARDVQDTFFLSNPKSMPVTDKELVRRMKAEHENAWHIDWSEDIAFQAVARTHTTSVTGRYIHSLVDQITKDPDKYPLPIKLFTIGRNFRNENIDYKHLADFYQTDGIIIGKNLTLANLFDTLIRLYRGIGINVKFVPLYYPFVEPGVHVLVEINKEWMEIGGAGIIRREITGVDRKKINVLAWGLALERLLLVKDRKIKSISELYDSSAGWLRERNMR